MRYIIIQEPRNKNVSKVKENQLIQYLAAFFLVLLVAIVEGLTVN